MHFGIFLWYRMAIAKMVPMESPWQAPKNTHQVTPVYISDFVTITQELLEVSVNTQRKQTESTTLIVDDGN